MNRRFFCTLLLALVMANQPVAAQKAAAVVRLQTNLGAILIEVDTRRAPITSANFLAYVDQRRFDNTSFYRAARTRNTNGLGLIQGGIRHTVSRALGPIAHEPTSRTGLRHLDGTVSMARNAPGTAMGDFFITVGPTPSLDAAAGRPGYAAFGKVVGGMDVVRRILAQPTFPGGFTRTTMGQSIRNPVVIITARRVR